MRYTLDNETGRTHVWIRNLWGNMFVVMVPGGERWEESVQ